MDLTMTPVGKVVSERKAPEDDDWDNVRSRIELDPDRFDADALRGLDAFSHVEVIFVFDRVAVDAAVTGARHPRNNPSWPLVGIFGQRGKKRPNRIGVTVCRIDRIEGLTVHLEGLDAIDGTPVLDIKPWMQAFGPRGGVREPEWSIELMRDYWSVGSQ